VNTLATSKSLKRAEFIKQNTKILKSLCSKLI